MKQYIVKYTWYHYNTGAGDNRVIHDEMPFGANYLQEAMGLAREIEEATVAGKKGIDCPRHLVEKLCNDCGYLLSFDGLFKRETVETKLEQI